MLTAAFLIQRRSDDQSVRDTAARILSSGKRMTRMIEDMLDLTRARLAGGIPLNRAAANLAAVVDRVVQEAQTAHPDRALEVVVEGDLTGEWDADRLQQIVSNLIGNAIQHGEPAAPIAVRVNGSAPEHVVFSVANAGSIPPDVLPSIFDPFHSGRQGRGEGLGLGLYIAQQIAEAHHGSIVVDSEPAKGTVFTVHMPRRLAEFVRL
jgi:signal transduction histidine kinase